jgi:hypothetical protein
LTSLFGRNNNLSLFAFYKLTKHKSQKGVKMKKLLIATLSLVLLTFCCSSTAHNPIDIARAPPVASEIAVAPVEDQPPAAPENTNASNTNVAALEVAEASPASGNS